MENRGFGTNKNVVFFVETKDFLLLDILVIVSLVKCILVEELKVNPVIGQY